MESSFIVTALRLGWVASPRGSSGVLGAYPPKGAGLKCPTHVRNPVLAGVAVIFFTGVRRAFAIHLKLPINSLQLLKQSAKMNYYEKQLSLLQ
jgi:hypothetical protein